MFEIIRVDTLGIEIHHRGAAAKAFGSLPDDVRIEHCGGVDADLLGPGRDQCRHVLDRADSAADGEGHEALLSDVADHVVHNVSAFMACGDVEKHQLISPLLVIPPGHLDRVAGVADVLKVHPFDHPPVANVQARDDAVSEHGLAS